MGAKFEVMIVTSSEMRSLEERAFAAGVEAEALMDEAGAQIAGAVRQFSPQPGRCVVHFGKGHNGGDALVAARHLATMGWSVELVPAYGATDWSALTRKKFAAIESRDTTPQSRTLVVLDGLLGIGGGGALREPIRSGCRAINHLRETANALVFAIDLPTGLDGDTGEADVDAVRADFTATIGFPKRGLVAQGASEYVGRICVLPLPALAAHAGPEFAGDRVATAAELAPLLPRRPFEMHKGECGRVGIVAGSRGLTGAALLCSKACVHAGAGLVTLYVAEEIYAVAASAACPEVMVRPVRSYLELLETRRDVLALGPGLGMERREEVLELVRRSTQPAVLDADALNVISTDLHALDSCEGPRLLTPHPGEMARLDPASRERSRRETVSEFASRWPHTLLLKGARTIVAERGKLASFNSTGSPGMATGGMGDVLTGVLAALIGQKLSGYDAARLGAWLCGRAAEIAISHGGQSEESLSASGVIAHLGGAFRDLRAGCY